MKYTEEQLKTATFTCPSCESQWYSYSDYRVHGERLRRCGQLLCNFAWPADDDSLHLKLAPKLPPKPTEEWLAEHGVRIKESTPRIPRKDDLVATWGLAHQQDDDYTETWQCALDNGTKFTNDKYDGLRWIVEAIPLPPKPTEEWLKANNVRLKEQLPRESKGGELIATWMNFRSAEAVKPYDLVYRNEGANGAGWGESDPFQQKRYILEELPPNPHQRFLDAVKAGKNVWCKQAGFEREGKLCCINTGLPSTMEHTIRMVSDPEKWLLVEGVDIPMRPTQEYLDKYGFKLKDCCRPLVKGDWYHGWRDTITPLSTAPDTWTWNEPSNILWNGYRWILEPLPKVDTQQEFKDSIERKLGTLEVTTKYEIQRIRRDLEAMR